MDPENLALFNSNSCLDPDNYNQMLLGANCETSSTKETLHLRNRSKVTPPREHDVKSPAGRFLKLIDKSIVKEGKRGMEGSFWWKWMVAIDQRGR